MFDFLQILQSFQTNCELIPTRAPSTPFGAYRDEAFDFLATSGASSCGRTRETLGRRHAQRGAHSRLSQNWV